MNELLNKIQSRGYWKVIIRPIAFDEKRIENLAELYPIIQKTYVQLKHWRWEFPQINFAAAPCNGIDWIGQESEWDEYLELWRFYQSGQFVNFKGVYEDWRDNSTRRQPPPNWAQGRYLEVEDTLLQFTEIFEFAARLAFTPAGDARMCLDLCVHNLAGRGLKLDLQRKGSSYLGILTASVKEMPYKVELPAVKLVANPAELALRPAAELFQRFGWDPGIAMLRDIRDDRLRL